MHGVLKRLGCEESSIDDCIHFASRAPLTEYANLLPLLTFRRGYRAKDE